MVARLGENVDLARRLRVYSTDVERKLWSKLRNRQLGAKFRRQVSIGPFIADFCCLDARLIIELDGSQHADNPRDVVRDEYLAANDFKVLRFWNSEINDNLEGVLHCIAESLNAPSPAR